MSATADLDLDELAAEATNRLAELEHERLRLSLDALIDPKAASEFKLVEGRIQEVRREIERIGLARAEKERRRTEGEKAELREVQQAALSEARELDRECQEHEQEVEHLLNQAFVALRGWDLLTTRRESALRRAGQPQMADASRPKSWQLEVAIADAMRRANCPANMIGLETFLGAHALGPRHIQSFTQSVPRPFGRGSQNEEGAGK